MQKIKELNLLSRRTLRSLRLDAHRLRARVLHHRRKLAPDTDKLHFGCGKRRIPGWLNVDLYGSEYDIDLGAGALPFVDGAFSAIVSQHVIEHLDLKTQLEPLFSELKRVSKPGGEVWLSCPDMEKVCRAYLSDSGKALLQDRQTRWPNFSLNGAPVQHIINVLFHQDGEHVNLFDFGMLKWLLESAGFERCERVDEAALLKRFPEMPVRADDHSTLYVTARAS